MGKGEIYVATGLTRLLLTGLPGLPLLMRSLPSKWGYYHLLLLLWLSKLSNFLDYGRQLGLGTWLCLTPICELLQPCQHHCPALRPGEALLSPTGSGT